MQLNRFSRNFSRRGLQALALATACSITSTAAFACSQATPPTAERAAALVRIQNSFARVKAMAKAQAATPKDQTTPFSMVGMWMTTFISNGEVVDAGFDVWHSDGTQILNDFPPPVTGAVCIGIWQQTGPVTYELKHPAWAFDPETNSTLVGITYILEKVTLDPSGNSYSGTASLEGYDLDGNHVYHQDAEVKGERINADPPAGAGPMTQASMRLWPYVKSGK